MIVSTEEYTTLQQRIVDLLKDNETMAKNLNHYYEANKDLVKQRDETLLRIEQLGAKDYFRETQARIMAYTQELAHCQEQRDGAYDKIKRLDQANTTLMISLHHEMQTCEAVEKQRDAVEKHARELEAQVEALRGRAKTLERDLLFVRQIKEEVTTQRDEAEQHIRELEAQVEALQQSNTVTDNHQMAQYKIDKAKNDRITRLEQSFAELDKRFMVQHRSCTGLNAKLFDAVERITKLETKEK